MTAGFLHTFSRLPLAHKGVGSLRRQPRRLHTFSRLPLADKACVVHAALACLAIEAGLRLLPVHRLARAVGTRSVPGPPEPGARPMGDSGRFFLRERAAVDMVMRSWPWGDTCLRRALVLGHLLRSEGAVFRIGARRQAESVETHAWVEVRGRALGETPEGFVALRRPARLPRPEPRCPLP